MVNKFSWILCGAIGLVGFTLFTTSWANQPESAATPVSAIRVPEGFKVELLYSVPREKEGSWVSLTTDPQGRLITSDQYGKLYRITPAPIGSTDVQTKIEPINVDLGMAQGLLYAFDSLYVVVNAKDAGLYRVRDTDGDDQFDHVERLLTFEGPKGEHGPHAVVLSPDGKSLFIAAGNHTTLPDISSSRVPRNWQEDLLLPRMWDAGGHAVGLLAPGGWIVKVDPDGKNIELVSSGYRNQYDIAFDRNGELFTYDADMEWDVGAPWYRPTRVNHATSGSEFGWRSGSGKWPAYYPDSLPAVVDVGPGSPTGVAFGTGAKFPARYQDALFIADWSYGIIYATHLKPDGASFQGELEHFISASPLPVTDMVVNPLDGALYFAIGGRKTQSGLYRVTYVGTESTAPVEAKPEVTELAKLRKQLERFHFGPNPEAIAEAWPYLGHADRFISYAARVAVEHQPVDQWQAQALSETNPQATILAMIALARNGDKSLLPQIVDRLNLLNWSQLDETLKLNLLRAYGLALTRMGPPDASTREKVLSKLDPLFPAATSHQNRELAQILIYLEAPNVVERTLDRIAKASTQEEEFDYAFMLRSLKSGWTLDQRRQYFEWFNRGAGLHGGHSYSKFQANTRNEAIENLTEAEKTALAAILEQKPTAPPQEIRAPRAFVKNWTVAELAEIAENATGKRDFARGREMFAATDCFKCHRFAGEGGSSAPDLTAAGGRFSLTNLLESIIEPSKEVSDQYEATVFLLNDGRRVVGRIANLNNDNLSVVENMLNPGKMTNIKRDDIDEMSTSKLSMMPTGLIDTLSEEEILDLLAYLRSGGNPDHEFFRD